MNRISIQAAGELLDSKDRSLRNAFTFALPDRTVTEHSLFIPLHYEPNYAYPLLVWLHGPGDDYRQLKRVIPHISLRNYVAVSPSSRLASVSPEEAWTQDAHSIAAAAAQVADSTQRVCQDYRIAADRIILAGFDAGGTMALRLGLAMPGPYAGVVSLLGKLPQGLCPLAQLNQARRLPLLIAQGRHSRQYTVAEVCQDLKLLHAAGMSVTLRQYNCGHDLTTCMLNDMDAWMMELFTQRSTCCEASASPPPGSAWN